jgi:hypothetical protein
MISFTTPLPEVPMPDSHAVIASHRRAISAFVDAARAVSPAQWTTPVHRVWDRVLGLRDRLAAALTAAVPAVMVITSGALAQDPRGPVPGPCVIRSMMTGDEDGATLFGRPDLMLDQPGFGIAREIRLTVGGGIGLQSYTMRLSETDSGVAGEMFVFWPAKSSHRVIRGDPRCKQHFDAQDTWLAGLAAKSSHEELACGDIRDVTVFQVCRIEFAAQPKWSDLLAQVEANDVWSLPDPVTLPPPKYWALDAPGLTVVLRDETTVRRFTYWPSHSEAGLERQHAARIQALVKQVVEQVGSSSR